jgi:3-dehydroquinate synthase
VAIGMVIAAGLSESRGLCVPGTTERLAALLLRFGLPVQIPADLSIGGLARGLELDKKAVFSGLRLILLDSIGSARVDDRSGEQEISDAMRSNRVAGPTPGQESRI